MVTISLIMPTISRVEEISWFLDSLLLQTYKDFELIIVDQNKDERLMDIIKNFDREININYIKSDSRGLSLNRNIGIAQAKGSILAFPDDDCIYDDPNILLNVIELFKSDYDFVSCNTIDYKTKNSVVRLLKSSGEITWQNVFHTSISFTIFIKDIPRNKIVFDEKLGVGSIFGSSEESDLIFHLLNLGYRGYYRHDYYIHHPSKLEKLTSVKGYNYGLGMGALYRKNICYRMKFKDIPKYIFMLLKPFIGMFLIKNTPFYWNTLKGRIIGFISYNQK